MYFWNKLLTYLYPNHLSRFTSPDDFNWFTKTMSRVITEEFGDSTGLMIENEAYFVDFMR